MLSIWTCRAFGNTNIFLFEVYLSDLMCSIFTLQQLLSWVDPSWESLWIFSAFWESLFHSHRNKATINQGQRMQRKGKECREELSFCVSFSSWWWGHLWEKQNIVVIYLNLIMNIDATSYSRAIWTPSNRQKSDNNKTKSITFLKPKMKSYSAANCFFVNIKGTPSVKGKKYFLCYFILFFKFYHLACLKLIFIFLIIVSFIYLW